MWKILSFSFPHVLGGRRFLCLSGERKSRRLELHVIESAINTVGQSHKFIMRAQLGEVTFADHGDAIGITHGRQSVSNDKDGFIPHQIVDGLLHDAFRFVVQSGGGFVQNDDGGIFQKGASNGHTLFLPAGEENAAFSDFGIDAVGQAGDEVGEVSAVQRAVYFLICGTGVTKQNVFSDGTGKEEIILKDYGDICPQGLQRIVPDILAVDLYRALRHVVKARQQTDQCAFASAGISHQSQSLSDFYVEIDILQYGAVVNISKADVLKRNSCPDALKRNCIGLVGQGNLLLKQFKNTLNGHE